MIFNSFNYIIFLLITFLIYYITKDKYRYIILLIASYIFYGFSNVKNIILLAFITLVSYLSGILLEKYNSKKNKKVIMFSTIVICLATLLYFKYTGFILQNINTIFNQSFKIEKLVVPLGISFFILQAITYPIDVYRKDVKVEKNLLKFATFIAFFPQILSGPIGKAKEVLPQYSQKHEFNNKIIKESLLIILIGLFEKIVIADTIAVGISNVYDNLNKFKGIPILIAVFLYSFQIYFDFVSYSNIARGSGKLFGYNLINNFNSPYFADSIKNFWSRWHISLSTWFRDYLYFPLGGNRKGENRTYLNILIVFLVSGLWHGAAYTFIIWGVLHGLYQIIERKFKIKSKYKIINTITTFLLVTFAWIFFRANNLNDAIYVIKNMFNINFYNFKEQILSFGLDKYDLLISVISIIIVLILEFINQKYKLIEILEKKNIAIKWSIYFIIIFSIIILGHYGPGFNNAQFIYLGY